MNSMREHLIDEMWKAFQEQSGAYVDRELGIVDSSGYDFCMEDVVDQLIDVLELRQLTEVASMVHDGNRLAVPGSGLKAVRYQTKWMIRES